jgi:hypothetical protein
MTPKLFAPALLAIIPLSGHGAEPSTPFPIPSALVAEHKALHATLGRAKKEPGAVGTAAQRVEAVLHPQRRRLRYHRSRCCRVSRAARSRPRAHRF